MITLFRLIRLWQLSIKWKLVFWKMIDKQAIEILKNPQDVEKKITNILAEIIHKQAEKERIEKENQERIKKEELEKFKREMINKYNK